VSKTNLLVPEHLYLVGLRQCFASRLANWNIDLCDISEFTFSLW
jgi:hypothetical protein